MEVDFQLLIMRIINSDKVALQQLRLVSSIIIKGWARSGKQELRWIASSGRPIDYHPLITDVINKYIEGQKDATKDFLNLEQYKSYLIDEFAKGLKICFSEFMVLLKNNEQQAWQIVFNDLENRSAAWFFKRSRIYKEEHHSLFCESIESVYSKFMNNEFEFYDSCAFKSYFFKTLENKFFESVKNPYIKKVVPLDSIDFSAIIGPDCEQKIEHNERQNLLKKAFLQLNHDERLILTDYFYGEKKLREIAFETGQTEENIRIKKHRALKKLFNHFKRMGYES